MKIQEPEDRRPGLFIAHATASRQYHDRTETNSMIFHMTVAHEYGAKDTIDTIKLFSDSTDLTVTDVKIQRVKDFMIIKAASLLAESEPKGDQ